MNHTAALPATVVDYFDRVDADDKKSTIELFTPDAQVTDDGHDYRGTAQISSWLAGAASEFTFTSTRLSAEVSDRAVLVLIRVEGNFPGGLVDLRHTFTLDSTGLISTLRIAPWNEEAVRAQ